MPAADTLLRLAEPPAFYEARWTDRILAEVTHALVARFGKTPEKARYREAAMREFFRDSIVENYEPLMEEMTNHPKDRHVLAAAVACRADYLVTFNLKDFPSRASDQYKIEVIAPSTFLKQLAVVDRAIVERRLREQAAAIGVSMNDLLDRLAGSVPGFVSIFRRS
jgi:predicted nucleic acid-binding protein